MQPLPAFDLHRHCILSAKYNWALQEALAHVQFSISKYSWQTGNTYKDTYVTNLDMIHIVTSHCPYAQTFSTYKRGLKTDVYTPNIRPS
jgi:hypothetical protein